MKHEIVTFPHDVATDCEGVLLDIDANHYATILYPDDMVIICGPEYQITYTGETVDIESIELKAVA